MSSAAVGSQAGRLTGFAPVLLAVSVAARLAWTYLAPNGANFVDLHVYIGGAAALGEPGGLYSYVYADQTPDFPLPFTYPPFAALVFYPLSRLPFPVVAFAWQIGIVAALYGVVRLSQRLIGITGGQRQAMLWTALGIWTEPLRSTFDYGQINVILALAVLWAVCSTRWWLSGLLVGVAAGIKLTPAISGLYFLGVRRWGTVVFAAVVFAGTVALHVQYANFINIVLLAGGHEQDLVFLAEDAVKDTDVHDDAAVGVEDRIVDQCTQWLLRVALGRRNTLDHGIQDLVDANAGLRRRKDHVFFLAADKVDHLLLHIVDRRDRTRQVDLVYHRNDLQTLIDGHEQVRDRLRLYALRCIDDQQRPFTGRE